MLLFFALLNALFLLLEGGNVFSWSSGERGVPIVDPSVAGDIFEDEQPPVVDVVVEDAEDIEERDDAAEDAEERDDLDDCDDLSDDDEYDDDDPDSDPDTDRDADLEDSEPEPILYPASPPPPLLVAVVGDIGGDNRCAPLDGDDEGMGDTEVDVGETAFVMGTLSLIRCVKISIQELYTIALSAVNLSLTGSGFPSQSALSTNLRFLSNFMSKVSDSSG